MLPGSPSTSLRVPGAAIVAAVFGMLSTAVAVVAIFVVLTLTGGEVTLGGWLSVAVLLGLLIGLVGGVVLLLLGRSWLVLLVSSVVLTVLVLAAGVFGGSADASFAVFLPFPLTTAVLAGLSENRSWVEARRQAWDTL